MTMPVIEAPQALLELRELSQRFDEANSTPALRERVEQVIQALQADEEEAVRLINDTAARTAQLHNCADHASHDLSKHEFQADEEQTGAYGIFDKLRFGYGYRHRGQRGNNIVIL